MKRFLLLSALLAFLISCTQSQEKQVGGSCEGCEAIYEYGNQALNAVDTIPGFGASSEPMKVTGVIYDQNGDPAENVILYLYHTNEKGIYKPTKKPEGWEKRHGQHRGWIKTGPDGKYTFYTFRPASYPNTTVAQHIHATIKEPGYSEYYIDSYHFHDDPNLTDQIKNRAGNRGGSGIIELNKKGGLLVAERNIVLGKNIPGY